MFDSRTDRDPPSSRLTRRVFLAAGAASVAAFAVAKLRQAPGVEASTAVHGTPGIVAIVEFSDDGHNLGAHQLAKVVRTDGEWYRQLGANSFNIARKADTEMPWSGVSLKEHRAGIFRCVCCATALFSTTSKFDSHTGWPSFWAPLAKGNIVELTDGSLGFERTEVQCTRCEAHLGHVFNDGPDPTGLRYCMNSASLKFSVAA